MKKLSFPYPFSGFRDLDFTNCFTGLYMHLEGITGNDDFECPKKHGKPCLGGQGCTNCHHSTGSLQEGLFFLFDTVSGRSATVRGWGKKPTAILQEIYDNDDMIEFVMGYAGYGYEKHSGNLMEHIRASIDKGTPVLARLKKDEKIYLDDGKADSFRVIIGCDGNKLLMPEPKGAQNKPKRPPRLDEIDSVYVITGKTQPKYTLIDALRRIRRVMEFDRENGTWDEYIRAFEKYWDRLQGHSLKELKALHRNAWSAANWNCHNFGSALCIYHSIRQNPESAELSYGNWIWGELKDERLVPALERLGGACDDSHTHQWQLRSLYETRDWRKKYYNEMEWGMCENEIAVIRLVKADDDIIYRAVCEMIEILSQK